MRCPVCEEKLDTHPARSRCPRCGFPVFRILEDTPSVREQVYAAAARFRDDWIGGAELWIVVYKYRRTPEGLVCSGEDKIRAAVYRELGDHEIHWIRQPFGSLKTDRDICIDLKIHNGDRKCIVSVPMRPPGASGACHVGLCEESPGYLRMYLEDGNKRSRSGRISIHEAGKTAPEPVAGS